MNWQSLKAKYERFKRWQREPMQYHLKSGEVQHCKNCGNDFTGNFCPICSQRADTSRICWRSVHQGVMDIWGLGTRSLLYSIWQLLLRPGHVISDYIDGKRQVSFPPVKMLFIVTLIYSFVIYWFLPDVVHLSNGEEDLGEFTEFYLWYKSHLSWAMLIIATFAILPTWVMFRYSPRHTRHTIPEGFFLQVFMQVIGIVWTFLLTPFDYFGPEILSFSSNFAVMVYYVIVYKHFFGYSLWGTLWRQGFVLLCGLFTLFIVVLIAFPELYNNKLVNTPSNTTSYIMGWIALLLWPLMVLGVGHVINRIATRIRARRQ